MSRPALHCPLLAAFLILLAALPARAQPELVVLVRHADKASQADEPGRDPGLSAAGQRRAEQLAEALAAAGIRHVLATAARRTQATAAPLAQRLGLEVQAVGFEGGLPGHVAELHRRLQGLQGNALVVGHSNTLPELLQALGGPRWPMLCESSYGQVWLLQLRPPAPPQVLRLRYGAPDPEPSGPDCQ